MIAVLVYQTAKIKIFINIGCGDRYKKGWANIDFVSSSQSVLKHDLKSSTCRWFI